MIKRVAIFIPGGVGDEASGVHIPSIVSLISRLSDRFAITVYPLISPATEASDYRCGNAIVRNLHLRQTDHPLTQLSQLAKLFLRDHHREPYQLLHGFWALPTGFAAVALGKFLHVPSIVSVLGAETANLPEIDYGNLRHSFTRQLTLRTCRHADTLIALTQAQIEALRSYGIDREDIRVIPPAVDANLFQYSEKLFPRTSLRCLHVANLNEVKDQETLLQAFALIAKQCDARLRIAGRDYLGGRIQVLAERLGVMERVEFLGFQTQQQLLEQYRWADILLHTSLHEGGGVVIAEAAATGVVVCGTNVGLIADLGRDRAVIVEPGDHIALAREVLNLLAAPERYHQLRERAHQWSLLHDLDRAVEELSAVYSRHIRG